MNKLDMMRIACVSPELKLLDIEKNSNMIINAILECEERAVDLVVFPERTLTGSTAGDIITQQFIQEKIKKYLLEIVEKTIGLKIGIVLGTELEFKGIIYNCGLFIQDGEIKGIVPKLQNDGVYDRTFSRGNLSVYSKETVNLFGREVPFGLMIFSDEKKDISVGIEMGSDVYSNLPVSTLLADKGVDLVVNPWSEMDGIGVSEKRKSVVSAVSGKNKIGYVACLSGIGETVTDGIFVPHHIFAEVGKVIKEDSEIVFGEKVTMADLDLDVIKFRKKTDNKISTLEDLTYPKVMIQNIKVDFEQKIAEGLFRKYDKKPLVPNGIARNTMCQKAFDIQSVGLARRIETIKAGKCVVGISGGLDSTLAVLVAANAMKILGRDSKDVLAITMPGFGTTGKTYENALELMKLLEVEIREISIKTSVEQHLKDIGHSMENKNVTYENAQARERTQILMDIANEERGLVLGTGDLSEMALGWCTFNGDHMSMYGVNSTVSKTFIREIVRWIIEEKLTGQKDDISCSLNHQKLKNVLQEILDTPISPELLPPDEDGNIAQKTEETLGSYEIHDFFLYYTLNENMKPEKLFKIAVDTFKEEYDKEEIRKWLITFYRRFFTQQFKRNCSPEGAGVGSISLSPRGFMQMPSDLKFDMWIKEVEDAEV